MRLTVPTSPSSGAATARVVDTYTKQGATGGYQTLLALSPDHGVGYAMLVGGPQAGATYSLLQGKLNDVWVGAAEAAGREAAKASYEGTYAAAGEGSVFACEVGAEEPGILVSKLTSDGADVMALFAGVSGVPAGEALGVWLYPMGLAGGNKVAFRAVFGVRGQPPGEQCNSWGSLDLVRYGGLPSDLFIFELGKDGKAVAVEVPVLKKTFRRDGKACKRA